MSACMRANPLRIALLTHSTNPRGGVVHCLELADALCAQGHAVTVHAPGVPGQPLFRSSRAAVRILPVPASGPGLREVVQARIGVLLHRLDRLVGIRRDDPPLGDLLDRQLVGEAFHLAR